MFCIFSIAFTSHEAIATREFKSPPAVKVFRTHYYLLHIQVHKGLDQHVAEHHPRSDPDSREGPKLALHTTTATRSSLSTPPKKFPARISTNQSDRPAPGMSYPPQRPPFEQMSSSQSYMSDPLSLSQSHHSHSAPLRSPYDPETPGPVVSNAPGHKLHRPSWMMAKESDLGYTELDNSRGQGGGGGGYGQNEHGHRSDELLTVLPAGEESKTFVSAYIPRTSRLSAWFLYFRERRLMELIAL